MTLVYQQIKELINDKVITNAIDDHVGAISYDLVIKEIMPADSPKSRLEEYSLSPQDFVFIACEECLELPNNIVAFVEQRNSRIREGLVVDAPTYQPGHKTRIFFRLRNISSNIIKIAKGDSVASVRFEKLDTIPDKTYQGEFVDEFLFKNLGSYEKAFEDDVEKVKKEIDKVENIEKNIYGNVITLMTIFIGIFSLINLNFEFFKNNPFNLVQLITYNLIIIGSLGLFAAFISLFLPKQKCRVWQFIIPILLLIAALVIVCLL